MKKIFAGLMIGAMIFGVGAINAAVANAQEPPRATSSTPPPVVNGKKPIPPPIVNGKPVPPPIVNGR